MHPTLEMRWFLKGQLPADLHSWFTEATTLPLESETRADWYLCLPNRNLGIKLRQGNLEIKRRLEKQGRSKLAKRVRGKLEQWVKWHFAIEVGSDFAFDFSSGHSTFQHSGLWLRVNKKRWCKHYTIAANGKLKQVESMQQAKGCTLELSELQVGDQIWYSLCFEAPYEAKDPVEAVATVELLRAIVETELEFPTLKARYSFGYPDWLHQVQQNEP